MTNKNVETDGFTPATSREEQKDKQKFGDFVEEKDYFVGSLGSSGSDEKNTRSSLFLFEPTATTTTTTTTNVKVFFVFFRRIFLFSLCTYVSILSKNLFFVK